jgi:hypothetical protein
MPSDWERGERTRVMVRVMSVMVRVMSVVVRVMSVMGAIGAMDG